MNLYQKYNVNQGWDSTLKMDLRKEGKNNHKGRIRARQASGKRLRSILKRETLKEII